MARPRFLSLSPAHAALAERDGNRSLLAFAGCNYLGLSFHPVVREALLRGLDRFGLSASASRETTGNVSVYDELERALAAHMGHDAAVLTPEGYTANLAVAEVLAERCGRAVIDERSHRSVGHAMRAAGMAVSTYAHLDAGAAGAALAAARRAAGGGQVVLCTDGVFAADGSVAPVPALLELVGSDDLLLVDDCHGLGTLGPAGEGTLRHHDIVATAHRQGRQLCVTTTLAKAIGCHGGAVLGSMELVARVVAASGLYRATTPIPPPVAAAALAAIDLLRDESTLHARLRRNVAVLHDVLESSGVESPRQPSPIAAFTTGTEVAMEALHASLRTLGILAPLIDYPGGPAPRYFRLSVSALHEHEHFERLGQALREALAQR